MKLIPIEVRAYSGYKAEETPRAFEFQGAIYELSAVDDRALELLPNGRLIRRLTVKSGGKSFSIAYDERDGGWFLIE